MARRSRSRSTSRRCDASWAHLRRRRCDWLDAAASSSFSASSSSPSSPPLPSLWQVRLDKAAARREEEQAQLYRHKARTYGKESVDDVAEEYKEVDCY